MSVSLRALEAAFLGAFITSISMARADEPKDAYGDPLPAGAKARLGTALGSPALPLGPDYKMAVEWVYEQGLLIREIATGRIVRTMANDRAQGGHHIATSADGSRLVTYQFGTVTVWDSGTGKPISEFKPGRDFPSEATGSGAGVGLVALSGDGKLIAFGASRYRDDSKKALNETATFATVWDAIKGERVARFQVVDPLQTCVSLSNDGKLLATCGVPTLPALETAQRPNADMRRLVQV